MNIQLVNHGGYLYLEYNSRYASGANHVQTPQDLVKAIEDVCGKGSYCLYQNKGERYPKAVDYFEARKYDGKFPTITYFMQGVKTEVIEQAKDVAIKIWGNIPEMEVGWLENQCRSYIEDIKD